MADVVLDASAILALVFQEPGAEEIVRHLPRAAACTVNVAEVAAKLSDLGIPDSTVKAIVDGLQLEVFPLDLDRAFQSGRLRAETRRAGLSLGDRACLTLAMQLGVPALTTDQAWLRIGQDVGGNGHPLATSPIDMPVARHRPPALTRNSTRSAERTTASGRRCVSAAA